LTRSDAQKGISPAAVRRITRISLTVADLDRSEVFYRDCFGFETAPKRASHECDWPALTGIARLRARSVVLRLGGEEIELVSFEPKGRGYPSRRTAADPWFQHFAIVVADMDRAYDALRKRSDFTPISRNGPERLPPNTGSVTAYKFRDPEGHPIELTMFPPGVGSAKWDQTPGSLNAVFLGIDHSAIAVANSTGAIAFYRGLLGMSVPFQTTNRGPEQERLDGLAAERVEITVLQPADPDSPHLELLEYPSALRTRAPIQLNVNDVAATRLWLECDDLGGLRERLRATGADLLSPVGAVKSAIAPLLLRDRDGHLLQLTCAAGE
jgi:catechol 2,3-dioxygenase-like lactoylglutathione lyase family enzyme